MTDLEQELRETLARHAPAADAVRAPRWDGAPAEPARRRVLVPAVAVAAVLAVLAVVVGVGSLVAGGDDAAPVRPASVVPTPPDAPRELPAGKRAVSYRGVEVLVGADFQVSVNCQQHHVFLRGEEHPDTDALGFGTVIVGPPSPSEVCDSVVGGIIDTPVVRLLPDDVGDGAALAQRATRPVELNGVPVLASECDGCAAGELGDARVVHLPQRGVVVEATVFGVGFPEQVFSTLRVADVDALGCAERAPLPEPATARADDELLWDGEAQRVTVCLYADGVSEGSGSVTGAQARTAAELLAAARPAVPGSPEPCGPRPGAAFDAAGVRIELAGGQVVTYAVVDDQCAPYVVVDRGDGGEPVTAAADGREAGLLTRLRGWS